MNVRQRLNDPTYSQYGNSHTQTLLSILRHKTVEKSLDKCELSVVEGVEGGAPEGEERPEDQSAETKLVIRMHCKFGECAPHYSIMPTLY